MSNWPSEVIGSSMTATGPVSGSQTTPGHIVVITSNNIIASTPAVSVISPPANASIANTQAVVFEVSDLSQLEGVMVAFTSNYNIEDELVHDGVVFTSTFTGPANSRVALDPGRHGWRYTVLRDGGWKGDLTILIVAVGNTGIQRSSITWLLTPVLK